MAGYRGLARKMLVKLCISSLAQESRLGVDRLSRYHPLHAGSENTLSQHQEMFLGKKYHFGQFLGVMSRALIGNMVEYRQDRYYTVSF